MPEKPIYQITGKDMWEKLEGIDNKVDGVDKHLGRIDESLRRHYERMESHSKKIRSLELRIYGIIAGIVAALGFELFRTIGIGGAP